MSQTTTAPWVPSATAERTMPAVIVRAPQRLELVETSLPQPGPGEVRLRLEGCGVCASNVIPWEGRPWFTYPMAPGALGHEGWGVIDAVGPQVDGFRLGERVAAISQHAYASYDLAPVHALVRLPAALAGQPFPAEPLGCAMNILRRSGVQAGDIVAIVGIGFLGALLTRLATNAGAQVLALSRRPYALDLARKMGADATIVLDDHGRILNQVKQVTRGRSCDVVIEAVGKQWPLDLAAELTRERGRLVIAGHHQDGLRQVNLQLWNRRGLDVINAHERDPRVYREGMAAAVDEVVAGRLDPTPLFTHRLPLSELGTALALTRERPDGFMKALIVM